MSQELVVHGARRELSTDQLKFISDTEFVPKSLRGRLPAIMACVATGRELGLGDLESLRSIHVIDGRPSMSAELMVKLVRRRGHSITGKVADGVATVTGRRADTGDEMTVEWTRDMAVRAGLTSKDNWKKYESSMLWARAASQLCRMLFPDCLGGVSHTPEEAEMSPEERVDDALGGAPAPPSAGPDDGHSLEEIEASPPPEVIDHEGAAYVRVDDAEPDLEAEDASFEVPAAAVEDPVVKAATDAAEFVIPNGQNVGKRLADLPDGGERGETWLRWALGHVTDPAEFRDALWAYARVFYPDLYEAATATDE